MLSDPKSRKNYDYALAHPEETLYNEYQYYNSKFSMYWKTDPLAVIFGTIIVISLVQYFSRLANYRQVKNIPYLFYFCQFAVIPLPGA